MAKQFTDEDDELLTELGIDVEAKEVLARTPKEERVMAGFEEIQRFVEDHGRPPEHGEDRDIFERLYAIRLDRIREIEECRALVTQMDNQNLLDAPAAMNAPVSEDIDDDALLAELGVEVETASITELRHVRSNAEKRVAEEIATRERCEDFENFKPRFERVKQELYQGVRISRVIRKDAGFLKTDIRKGEFFILGGQTLYIAELGLPIKAPNGETDARLRVIYSNGTESNILLRSLQRAMYKDETSRRITEPTAGPLFSDQSEKDDLASGTVYVLRSKSDHPVVAQNRELLHKIGVTGGKVEKRIANAEKEATFLLAGVEVVATYQLFNINRAKFENVIHRVFEPAKLNIKIMDRFGRPFTPREWFLVPLSIVDELIQRITDQSISLYKYDPSSAKLIQA